MEYNIIKTKQNTHIIEVRCPKEDCGRIGSLVSGGFHKYAVVHSNDDIHKFGYCSEHYDEMKEIYREIRQKQKLR